MNDRVLPLLAITMGDPSGIGAEVIVAALSKRKVRAICRPLIVGDARIIRRAAEAIGKCFSFRTVMSAEEAAGRPSAVCLLDLRNADPDAIPFGQVSALAGRAAAEYIMCAANLAQAAEVRGIVTAPINKEALRQAGMPYPGHTEMLSALCGGCEVAMMLVYGDMRVSHVTTHVALRQACDRVKRERVLSVIRLTDQALRRILGLRQQVARPEGRPPGPPLADLGATEETGQETRSCPTSMAPRIAVAGLNPHAGESGLFGDEEAREIAPAVANAQADGINAVGPLPPDTAFARQRAGEFDAVVAMVHDHGHIAVKTVGFRPDWRGRMRAPRPEGPAWRPTRLGLATGGVNLTLGLPIIRTSVDHGTAFEIAGKGIADPTSMVDAITLAAEMAGG